MLGRIRSARPRSRARLAAARLALALLALLLPASTFAAQLDPAVRDRVVPAVVQLAVLFDATERGVTTSQYVPVGSATVVSPDGIVLTNFHVVDMAAHQTQLDAWSAEGRTEDPTLAFALDRETVLLLGTDGASRPEPLYVAAIVAVDEVLDLAVLRVTGDGRGAPLDVAANPLPYLATGNSGTVQQGDPIDLWGYPAIADGSLTYTAGVVSGFTFEDGIAGPAWIVTDATMSGGSSGGAALDRDGRLIGIPTQGSSLDCRPGDTTGDGEIDAEDVGCIPTGGAIGQVRPLGLALPLLRTVGVETVPHTVDAGSRVESGATAAEAQRCACADPLCLITQWETEGPPRRLAVAPDGTVLAAVGSNDDGHFGLSWPQAISAFAPGGAFLRRWPEPPWGGPIDLTTYQGSDLLGWGDGTVAFASDVAVAPDGAVVVLTTVTLPGTGYGPIMSLEAFGEITLSDSRIKVFDRSGVLVAAWGRDGWTEQDFGPEPVAVDVAPNGDVYVLDAELGRVQRFTSDGTFLGAWGAFGSDPGEFDRPQGIAVGPDGTVYVADTGNHRIQRFAADGAFLAAWDAPGVLNVPSRIAVGPDGTVYVVVGWKRERIARYTATGDFIDQFPQEHLYVEDVALAPDGTMYAAFAVQDEYGVSRSIYLDAPPAAGVADSVAAYCPRSA
jgi:S1-C subfamily serine protease/DNA-binding beta-propeller fold protein YncE